MMNSLLGVELSVYGRIARKRNFMGRCASCPRLVISPIENSLTLGRTVAKCDFHGEAALQVDPIVDSNVTPVDGRRAFATRQITSTSTAGPEYRHKDLPSQSAIRLCLGHS